MRCRRRLDPRFLFYVTLSDPMSTGDHYATAVEELESLSRIIAELNERFGLNLGPEHRLTLGR
ncbi:MAG: hypothetical protein HY047_02640 [Acidobacteria bacterium]|nr:hypothetical protein [Acidobacteriota bacterium]